MSFMHVQLPLLPRSFPPIFSLALTIVSLFPLPMNFLLRGPYGVVVCVIPASNLCFENAHAGSHAVPFPIPCLARLNVLSHPVPGVLTGFPVGLLFKASTACKYLDLLPVAPMPPWSPVPLVMRPRPCLRPTCPFFKATPRPLVPCLP